MRLLATLAWLLLRNTPARHQGLQIEKTGGRWIAAIPTMPGVCAYGSTAGEAAANVKRLAQQVREITEASQSADEEIQ